jgi:hypothetical protein
MKIHNVFHVSLLKPVAENDFSGRKSSMPIVEEAYEDLEYEIEPILDSTLRDGHGYYLVKWKVSVEKHSIYRAFLNAVSEYRIAAYKIETLDFLDSECKKIFEGCYSCPRVIRFSDC